jgi:hypothetical protein
MILAGATSVDDFTLDELKGLVDKEIARHAEFRHEESKVSMALKFCRKDIVCSTQTSTEMRVPLWHR